MTCVNAVGEGVGKGEGAAVGVLVGKGVGLYVGKGVGIAVGVPVGAEVGWIVGSGVGGVVGVCDGGGAQQGADHHGRRSRRAVRQKDGHTHQLLLQVGLINTTAAAAYTNMTLWFLAGFDAASRFCSLPKPARASPDNQKWVGFSEKASQGRL